MNRLGSDSALRTAILAVSLSVGLSVASRADELQAKLDYCKTCHGLSGQGYRGYFPMPRLAGQQPEYLENQLRAFIERRRVNPIMANVAHALSPSMISALATHFRHLDPRPIGGAPGRSLATGKRIFDDGLPEGLSWQRRSRPEPDSPACGAALRVHGRPALGLVQGARPGHERRHLRDHGADRA